MSKPFDTTLRTLNTNHQQLRKLLLHLENGESPGAIEKERRGLRIAMFKPMVAWITQPGGNRQGFNVFARNVSQNGFSILHERFAYSGSRIEIVAPLLRGGTKTYPGTVRFCRHITGPFHELGVRTDSLLDIRQLVSVTRKDQDKLVVLDTIDTQLSGMCLVVDDLDLDLDLASHWLEISGLKILRAKDANSAIKAVRESSPNFAIVDLLLGGTHGADLIQQLRNKGFSGPIAAISASECPEDQHKAIEAGACAFLQKPYEPRQLQELAGQLLEASESSGGEVRSSLAGKAELAPLLKKYAQQVKELAESIEQAWSKQDHETLRRACLAIKGSGATYGFGQISERAAIVQSVLAGGQERKNANAEAEVMQFISLLRRVAA
ncbi:MAG: response regulator [Phycisphaeraceae bacterium]|nr:response regulator [Phycisphaeraceae bacterium]